MPKLKQIKQRNKVKNNFLFMYASIMSLLNEKQIIDLFLKSFLIAEWSVFDLFLAYSPAPFELHESDSTATITLLKSL